MKQRSAEGQAGDSSRDQRPIVGCLAPHGRAHGHTRVPVAGCAQISRSPGVKKLLDFAACAGENARKRLSYGPFARYAGVVRSFCARQAVEMSLHLIKLCVGCDSVADLEDWIREKLKEKKRRSQKPEHIHTTRMVPKRGDELIDGGSLYWVVRGQIACRERILDIRPFTDKDGVGRCRIVLDGKVVLVEPRPRAAFQGWRYLEPRDAPRDLSRAAPGAARMPETMRRELRELGLL
jgi:hypothetical protein